jgi:hypothetical protein
MENSGADSGKRAWRKILVSVFLFVGGLADFFLDGKTLIISESLTLLLVGAGLIMMGQFGKRFVK